MAGLFGSIGQSAGSLTSALGNYIGMQEANDSLNTANKDYQNLSNQGVDTLKQGQAGANAAYQPYTDAGTTGINGETSAITNRTQSTTPTVTDNSSSNAVNNYLNPSAAYTTDQSNKSMEANAIASGGTGGGLSKALSANTANLAMTNYNNAYNQMLQSNNQTFNQQQQNYTNNNDYQQQQIQNYGTLANTGLSANNSNQQLQSGYNSGINSDYQGQAEAAWNTNASKAKNFNSGINNTFGNIGNSESSAGSALDSVYGMGG